MSRVVRCSCRDACVNLSYSSLAGPDKLRAYEVVDWLRLTGPSLTAANVARLLNSLERLHKPAVKEFCQYLDPRAVSLWKDTNLSGDQTSVANEYVSVFR